MNTEESQHNPQFQPLLEAEDVQPALKPKRQRPQLRVPQKWRDFLASPRGQRFTKRFGVPLLGVAIIGVGLAAYFILRPTPKPDYMFGDLDNVFDYTLLTSDFNKLPIEERVELVGQLVSRLKGMDSSDSMMMAAFAAGIAGEAREQLEENASKFAIDVWDKFAQDYDAVTTQERETYLESSYVDMVRMMAAMAGEDVDETDEELIADAKREAQREYRRLQDPDRRPSGSEVGMIFKIMAMDVGGHSSAHQRARGSVMMRDFVRHFRGQGLSGGK